ncbi:ATPase family AAA domain-containing protein 5 [Pelodytes ibericus]
MAGILTAPAPGADYGAQPCKKQRKDEDLTTKTITNYFSPLTKNPEKVLSSPKSNNIADYFKKSSPVAEREQTTSINRSSPNQDNIRGDVPNNQTPTTSRKNGKVGKRGKRISLSKRLQQNESSNVDAGDTTNVCGSTGFMGSDTAALLAEICCNKADLVYANKSDFSSNSVVSNDKKPLKSKVGKFVKTDDPQTNQSNETLPEETPVRGANLLQSKSTSEESSLEVNMAETSCETGSTVTVSFEDFLKSQEKDTNLSCDPEGVAHKRADVSENEETEMGICESAKHPSPNTVTVQAQVHLSPPLQRRTSRNIAAIFLKKGENELERKSDQYSPEHEQCDNVFQKRKSNVVIPEEDLELDVMEIENGEPCRQKSTMAERQQFMKAFKQPGDLAKNMGKKSVGKKRDSVEVQTVTDSQKRHDCDVVLLSTAESQERQGEKQSVEKVTSPKLKKRMNDVKQDTTVNETPKIAIRRNIKKIKSPEDTADAKSELPAVGIGLRRSTRHRKSDTSSQKSPVKGFSETSSPILMSTPKVNKPCRKNVYKAEVITLLSDTDSPIRMRFTRLSSRRRQNHSLVEDEVFTPRSKKVTLHTNKAKELLEKAKAIQKNIAKVETSRIRSSRQHSRAEKRSVLEDSAAVIDLTRKNPKSTKNIRSLNDVLGKKAKNKKSCNIYSGLKKSTRKNNAPITIIDDGSEVSENSQDDEQFKAKRQFLMSGLPDSLKRHISKTAALMEAYSVSGSSFQAVVHMQQKDSRPIWNLNMPLCPRLNRLSHVNDVVTDVAKLTFSLGDFTFARAKPSTQLYLHLVSSRPVFSDVIRNSLLDEICTSNPPFPVKRFLRQFLKKQSDQLALQGASKQDGQSLDREKMAGVEIKEDCEDAIGNRTKRKRKESPATKSKRLKSAAKAGDQNAECDVQPPASSENIIQVTATGPLSRAGRRQQRQASKSRNPQTTEEQTVSSTAAVSDLVIEDNLWTEKYQPLDSSELIGNFAAIKRLHGWLKDWKIRAEKEEKRNQMNKIGKDKNDTWDQNDFIDSSDSDEESLCNTVLITGPPGVGKTAAVYACAHELGFKVFEVNASCQRNGRQILTQLKEATQSHQVDQKGVNAHKPCFFNSHSVGKSPRKLQSPKTVVSSPRKPPISPRGVGLRKGLAPKSLANFFKPPQKQKNEECLKIQEVPNKSLIRMKDGESKETKTQVPATGSDESQRKTATSLILFEEVDVIFDEDLGFLSAIKTFMATTKRPVILTTSDPTFGLMFDGVFEEIKFHTPSLVNVTSYLQVLCLAENLRTDPKDLATFLAANKCDIRQSVLHLQFWAKSGGGSVREKQALCSEEHGQPSTDGKEDSVVESHPKDLPKCNLGCAENIMGINNIISPAENVMSFIKTKITDVTEWSRIVQLLTEFQMKRIHFISSNLEFLLPLPVVVMETEKQPITIEVDDPAEESPVKMSAHMKHRKQLVLLNDSDLFESNSNSTDEMLNLPSDNLPQNENKTKEPSCDTPLTIPRKKLTDPEKKSSYLVQQCLGSIAEFMDNMSHLDCLTYDTDQTEFCESNWTNSRIKNGLCDELRVEVGDWWSVHNSRELKANLETLSYYKCSSDISKFIELSKQPGEELGEELTLHVAKERYKVSFGQAITPSEIAERRLSIVRRVLSHKSFISLGNRQANVTDYLPALRNICRLEQMKEQGKTKRRFLHYLEGIHLELPKTTLCSLAADFP